MPQYKFIAVVGETGKPAKLTTSMRSHSIRTALRKSRPDDRKAQEERAKRAKSATPRNAEGEATTELSVPLTISRSCVRVRAVGDGRLDPFDSLPVPSNVQVDHLIRYFFSRYDLNSTTTDRSRLWFPYAVRSVPMMHSTLAMAAVLWRAESTTLERSIQIEGMRHKYEAIREVRSQLPHVGVGARPVDMAFLMSAMSTLVFVEIYDGNFEAAELHLHGVRMLFDSYRQRCKLEANFIFCKATTLADLLVATVLHKQLVFPTLHINQTPPPASMPDYTENPSFNQTIAGSNSSALVDIFSRLRYALLAQQSPAALSEIQRSRINDAECCILQYRTPGRSDLSDIARRNHTLVLAAQVFTYVTLRHVPPKSTLLRRMSAALQAMVNGTLTNKSVWAAHEQALSWIAFVGLLGTQELTDTSSTGRWFLELFKSACADNSDNREIFSSFLWDEAYCHPVLAWLEQRQALPRCKPNGPLTHYCPE